MISASTAFKAAADDPQRITQKKFCFPGATDRSSYLDDIGAFSQKQYEGDDLTAADISITLINDAKTFNLILTDKPGNLNQPGTLSLGFDGEYIDVYKGKLDLPDFTITNRSRVQLTFVHKLKVAIEQTLGSSTYPIDYTAAIWNPADLVWELLTTRAGLDATASTANPDIDYTQWQDFKTVCGDLQFNVKAYFTGESIAEALRIIGVLTDACIYPDMTGKVICRKFLPTENPSPYLFTDANAHMQSAHLWLNKGRVMNKLKCWYGYNPTAQTWTGSVTKDNAASQANYGLLGREFDFTGIWHHDIFSATSLAERVVARYTDPPETFEFDTKRGTQALLHQLGDVIQATINRFDYSGKNMQIYGIDANPMSGEYKLLVEDIGILMQNFFILDSATNGVLDQNVLY